MVNFPKFYQFSLPLTFKRKGILKIEVKTQYIQYHGYADLNNKTRCLLGSNSAEDLK